ncbi:MAG: hydroxylase [Streptosporangiales bacterium]|nr:hydroxylase [Streptosporangiales bacterium]
MTQEPLAPEPADAVGELLGVIAYAELVAFERLASYSGLAPSLTDKAALAELAVAEFHNCERLVDALAERGIDPELAMQSFIRPLDEFHAKTAPGDWLEGLVKAYVGDGLAYDFYGELAKVLDPATHELVTEIVSSTEEAAAFVVDRVRSAIDADPKLGGRLALWARRIVGEALVQAQRVAADREALTELLVGQGGVGADLAELGRVFNRILENHNDRMKALGLAS